jgi:hypothetical protein
MEWPLHRRPAVASLQTKQKQAIRGETPVHVLNTDRPYSRPPTQAGNTSSNSSSNSSNGVYPRVDTVIPDAGRGRSVYERRIYRQRDWNNYRSHRRWQQGEGDE